MTANLLSVARVLLLGPLLLSLRTDGPMASATTLALLAAAAVSDLADGYLARRLGQVSRLGRILDPLADKIFLGGLLIALALWRGLPWWLVALLLARDAGIVAMGAHLLRRRGLVAAANRAGKYTTVSVGLACLAHMTPAPAWARSALVAQAALMVLLSSVSYARLLRGLLQTAPEARR